MPIRGLSMAYPRLSGATRGYPKLFEAIRALWAEPKLSELSEAIRGYSTEASEETLLTRMGCRTIVALTGDADTMVMQW